MLACALVAGTVFLFDPEASTSYYNNFGYIAQFHLTGRYNDDIWIDFGNHSRTFDVPKKWQGQPADAVLNTCVAESRELAIEEG